MIIEPIRPDTALAAARRNALTRLIRCFFAEGLLDHTRLEIATDGSARFPLARPGETLVFSRLTVAPANSWCLEGEIQHVTADGTARRISTPGDLLDRVHTSLTVPITDAGIERVVDDMDDSIANDVAARTFRIGWNATLARAISDAGHADFPAYLRESLAPAAAANLLDRWAALEGHPFHPTWKSRPDLSPFEVAALSPEFDARVPLRLAAIRRTHVHLETMPHVGNALDWFADAYPDEADLWHDGLVARGLAPSDFLPLPIHPWHLKAYVGGTYTDEIAAGILITDGPDLLTAPAMSFRTMMPVDPADAPHIKLPIALWMTSEMRSLQAKSIHMGPRNSAVIATILAREGHFDGKLAIFPEEVAYHYRHAERRDDAPGRFLSVVFRTISDTYGDCEGLLPVPVAALFTGLPGSGRPFFTALVEAGGEAEGEAATPARIEAFFRTYVRTVVRPVIAIHVLYGIGLEAHQQNTIVAFDAQGNAVRTLVRDFGDGRSFAPLLRAQGLELEPYRNPPILPTVFEDDIEPVRALVLNACFVCHLHELALGLTRTYGLGDRRLWDILSEETAAAFGAIRDRADPVIWAQERAAFLHAPWTGRSLLRMHLEHYADYRRQHDLANPLLREDREAAR